MQQLLGQLDPQDPLTSLVAVQLLKVCGHITLLCVLLNTSHLLCATGLLAGHPEMLLPSPLLLPLMNV